MMTANRFKINQYNWFGQKLLTQHRYDELLDLSRYLSGGCEPRDEPEPRGEIEATILCNDQRLASDHLNYLTGLVMMKNRSISSKRIINMLQKLNYQKNAHYLLLLCQCLLYLGNHDSVVAICKQVFNKEIDTTGITTTNEQTDKESEGEKGDAIALCNDISETDQEVKERRPHDWCLKEISEESLEFKKVFDCVNKNNLINDPRLWFIFALCTDLQGHLRDADLAYRVASKLASGQAKQLASFNKLSTELERELSGENITDSSIASSVAISNYNEPHTKYAEFCIRHRDDYKTAIQVLDQARSINSAPVNYSLNPALALTLCSQPNSNANSFAKATEVIQNLDNHFASTRNPSFLYNQIALKCKQKLMFLDGTWDVLNNFGYAPGNESQLSLSYTLIKSFVIINDIVQNSSQDPMLFKISGGARPAPSSGKSANDSSNRLQSQIDKAIETLRNSDSSCWLSHSLWNNLGICYLMKRRYVASLSCFTKALQLNPLDWRINYNIGLVYLHVNVALRALSCSLASKSFHQNISLCRSKNTTNSPVCLLISSILANCYTSMGLKGEARRYYAEMIALGRKSSTFRVPVLAVVNYLMLLASEKGDALSVASIQGDDQESKLIYRLLDQLEQDWLQRNPNDTQFIQSHLNLALEIVNSLNKSKPKKTYAWAKYKC